MSNQQPSQPSSTSEQSSARPELAALQRRRALLSGLGKGSAAMAALAPLASRASSRNRVLFNSALKGNGYCSVSGFQSAAISSAPGATPCAATRPSNFFVATAGTYSDLTTGKKDTSKRRGIQAALAASPYSVTATDAQADLLTVSGGKATISGKVYIAGALTSSGGTFKELKATATFPTVPATITPVMAFNSTEFMGAGSSNTVLEELFLNSNNAYFAAAFLTCINEDRAVTSSAGFDAGVLPFDAAYVRSQYQKNQLEASVFFKALSPA